MNFQADSELHKRRNSRNWAVLVCLVVLMAIMVTLSMVKLLNTGATEGFDHVVRPALEVVE